MNTGSKLALASVALIASVTTLPVTAAPMFFQGSADVPFMVAGRDSGEFKDESSRQDERSARKAEKQSLKKDGRKNERADEPTRERESDQPGYGYGYERRYPVVPVPPNPRFDDRGRR